MITGKIYGFTEYRAWDACPECGKSVNFVLKEDYLTFDPSSGGTYKSNPICKCGFEIKNYDLLIL